MRIANRAKRVNPFRVMDVMARAQAREAAGLPVIHLEVGEPDFGTCEAIRAAGIAALQSGQTAYTGATGLPELRERIAAFYAAHHGVTVDPSRIIITPGASGALVLLSQLLLSPGDEVLMPDPSYPCNRNFVTLAGASTTLLPMAGSGRAAPDIEQLNAHLQTRNHSNKDTTLAGLWLASPVNPTGAIISKEGMHDLAGWCRKHNCHLLMDEIYHGLDFRVSQGACQRMGDLPSVLTVDAEALVVNSFSKYFGMTGWRIGWMVLPENLVERATVLAQNLFISASTPAQYAALRAFDSDVIDQLEVQRQVFRQRRDFLREALPSAGLELAWQPDGAFYCYVDISRYDNDCERFCGRILDQYGVAITPGTDFGDNQANRYARIAYTRPVEELESAVEQITQALQAIRV
ncbi:aminotransferase class I/II-fold pyridoxal phosphate-dependent enzyme [Pseudohongiella nitratireducens]|uniref:aminotransferase class I/II-fold pyridoxal phosphate-dependent enzyme n=1 Tax=Pseudohongiella nitratireducens TaxID=1768907 RepID=UPI0030EE3E98